ncbi:related to iron transport multicopper oxidase fio1 precursor [Lecanosticta acicola]|uniref:Related to iron transport multicopper oxidase fio1 n=1 Tax=Lecanosticta acicola TaxID=111012 RepID=A0AAI9EDY6_9PEZI|nr:related to iron transport multicopper oxidase fio1 precursor [Lecanosticta acicola]
MGIQGEESVPYSPRDDKDTAMTPSSSSSSSSNSSSREMEQERGLLSDWRDDDVEVVSNEKRWSEKRSPSKSIWIFMSLLITVVLVMVVVTASGFGKGLEQPASGQDDGEVKTNDYILDSNWDIQAPPQRREYSWTIRDREHNPDGIYRPMILVNNQFPGPLIEANEGDTIVVHVDNQAVNATSIHWHGLYQNSTPYMDGTVGVTQCPIPPGGTFHYEFTVSGQSGSYWWHAHQGVQSSDGLHGPLIIYSRDEQRLQHIPYDTDRVILLSDHYHDLSSALLWQYLKPDMENTEPVPYSGLINGRSIRNCDDFPDRRCDNSTANVGLPRIDLSPQKNHRLRLINVGAFAEFQVQLDEHQLAVTEVDGTDVEPQTYHRVNINPAQRYSVVVNTNATGADSFWFRARMVTTCFTDPPEELDTDALAVIRYHKDANEVPTSKDWDERLPDECKDMNTTDLVPVEIVAAPADADAFFYLRSNFEIGKYRLSRGFFNSTTFRPDVKSPSLQRTIDGLVERNGTFSTSSNGVAAFVNDKAFDTFRELVIQTTGIQTIDILVSNFDDGNHPLHLHGYKYFVLAQGHGYPPLTEVGADINRANLSPLYDSLDLSNPLRRDTASVEAYGWILLRVVADNPGAWAFHCHVSWHTEAGLMMQFLTRTDELADVRIPGDNSQLCAAEGLEKGMGPEDEDYRELAMS